MPADIPEFPRIFAVIDPENEMTEIHEKNNKGFNVLTVWNPVSIEPNTKIPIPLKFTLFQNYPNPFNSQTKIKFLLPNFEQVTIEVFNVLGQKVRTILDEKMMKGEHEVDFNASSLASGLYFYRIVTSRFVQVKKMILLN